MLAELDHLLATRVGATARLSLLGEVERGAYDLQDADLREAAETFGVPVEELDIAPGISLRGRLPPCS